LHLFIIILQDSVMFIALTRRWMDIFPELAQIFFLNWHQKVQLMYQY